MSQNSSSVYHVLQWSAPCRNVTVTPATIFTSFGIAYFTIPLAGLTSMCNIIILYTQYKLAHSRTASRTLLAILSIVDLPIGLIVQPIFVLFCVQDFLGSCQASLRIFHAYAAHFLCGCSASMLAIISVDRCIHVSFPLRSRAWDLKRIYTYVACSSCSTLGLVTALFMFGVLNLTVFRLIAMCFIACVLAASITSYSIIYYIIRRNALSVADVGLNDAARRRRLVAQKRAAKMIRLIFSVLFACYLPRLISALLNHVEGVNLSTRYCVENWSAFFVFLNAALNPAIYCAGLDDVRSEVFEIFSKFRSHWRGTCSSKCNVEDP